MNLHEIIKARRKTLAISQQDLADIAGLGVATIKDIERGKGNPSLSTVARMSWGWNSFSRCVRQLFS